MLQKPEGRLNTTCLTSIGISIIKIRRYHNCLIAIMEILLHGKTIFILRRGPGKCNLWTRLSVFPISWWRHEMEVFSALLALYAGNSPVTDSPHKSQWIRALMFSLICAWTNSWVNNRDAVNLRRHRAHHNVTLMRLNYLCLFLHPLSLFL